jgi:hypothetical protein
VYGDSNIRNNGRLPYERFASTKGLELVHQVHLIASALYWDHATDSRNVLRVYPVAANLTTRLRESPSSAFPCAPFGSQWRDRPVTPSNPSGPQVKFHIRNSRYFRALYSLAVIVELLSLLRTHRCINDHILPT